MLKLYRHYPVAKFCITKPKGVQHENIDNEVLQRENILKIKKSKFNLFILYNLIS